MANKLTPELLEKAKAAKSAEELIALAKENGAEITAEEAHAYFAKLNSQSDELSDDELDQVAGGCYVDVYDKFDSCGQFTCRICGGSDPNCTLSSVCANCKYATKYAGNSELIKCIR